VPYPSTNSHKGELMHKDDQDILVAICHTYLPEEILNIVASVATQQAHALHESLPHVPESLPKIDRAFLRAQLLTNTIANLITTQQVDKNHYT